MTLECGCEHTAETHLLHWDRRTRAATFECREPGCGCEWVLIIEWQGLLAPDPHPRLEQQVWDGGRDPAIDLPLPATVEGPEEVGPPDPTPSPGK